MDWNDPEWVRFFAERSPDVHLLRILGEQAHPAALRVLDLGCAAGRNTEAFLRAGCETYALDLAPAMLQATCRRVADLWPPGTGPGGVLRGDMRGLPFREGVFDFIAALGIFHEASCEADLVLSWREAWRVLKAEGQILVSVFGVEMLPPESRPVGGERFHYRTPEGRILCRLSAQELLEVSEKAGFVPIRPLEKRSRKEGEQFRVTYLGLFKKVEMDARGSEGGEGRGEDGPA